MAKRRYRTIETDIFGVVVQDTINSKKKGDNNERVAAKFMTKWCGEKFTRVPQSGGLRWKQASIVCGDIVCENEEFYFPFSVETKHYKSFSIPPFDNSVLGKRTKLGTFWEQTERDAKRANRIPITLARCNGMESGSYIVLLPLKLIREYYQQEKREIDFGFNIGKVEGLQDFIAIQSKDFLKINYENFVTYIKNHYFCKS